MDIVSTVKTALEIAERTKNLDLKKAILDLQEEVQNQRGANLTLRDENATLREELAKERAAKSEEGKVVACDGAYFRLDPASGKPDGPFCLGCFDSRKKLHRMTSRRFKPKDGVTGDYLCCGVCNYFTPAWGERFKNVDWPPKE